MRLLAVLLAVGFFDRGTEYVTDNPWTYAVVLWVSAVDAFFPLVPSETVVIAAGTISAGGDLLIYAIVPAAALGAFAGDNISYFLGDTTFASGMLELTWRRFAVYDAIGASVWALYAGMIGFLGGSAFRDELWKALALAFGLALLLAVAIEGWRRLQQRRGKDIFGEL
jgi:membrane-associated protein